MDPINSNKYKLYINGKFKGYVYGTRTTIHIPAELTEECGRAEIFAEIDEGNEDDTHDELMPNEYDYVTCGVCGKSTLRSDMQIAENKYHCKECYHDLLARYGI